MIQVICTKPFITLTILICYELLMARLYCDFFGDVNYCSYMFPLPECEKMKQRVSKAEKQATEMERSHQGVFITPTELYKYEKN